MLVHMKKPPIKTGRPVTKSSVTTKLNSGNKMILVYCPALNAVSIKKFLEKNGCICVDDGGEWLNAKGLFAKRTPATMLVGARGKESITQMQLSQLTGIPRRHISDMENGRRPIGKQNALKLGKALNISYRLLL